MMRFLWAGLVFVCAGLAASESAAEIVDLKPAKREVVYMTGTGWVYYDSVRKEKPEKVPGMENTPDPDSKPTPVLTEKPACPT